jgi:hypothetical protein
MMRVMVLEFPLRTLVRMSGGRFPRELVPVLLGVVNDQMPASALTAFIPR